METEKLNIFINKFKDVINFSLVKEFYLIDSKDSEFYVRVVSIDNEITSHLKFDLFEEINKEYYLIYQDKFTSKYTKSTLQEIFKISNYINDLIKIESSDFLNICFKILNSLCSLMIIGCADCTTLFNIKREYLFYIDDKIDKVDYLTTLVAELRLINLINLNNRKSSTPWEYRYFIFNRIFELEDSEKIVDFTRSLTNKTTSNYYKSFKDIIRCFFPNSNIENFYKLDFFKDIFNCKTSFILLFELEALINVNLKESRNYHMWKYLLLITKLMYSKNLNFNYLEENCKEFKYIKLLLLIFSLGILVLNNRDYSAFHFAYNLMLTDNLKIIYDFSELNTYLELIITNEKEVSLEKNYLKVFYESIK
jgi:hypothetical protein